jgi:uncharacterized protein YggT (Ycf19 family)
MGIFDFILNLACLLLWLSWRSAGFAAIDKPPPVSLAATLKRAEPHGTRAFTLATLLGILGVRSLFYWNVGSALNWTATLELGVISLPFRSDQLSRMFLYSLLSFVAMLAGLYAWLLLLSVVNRSAPPEEPFQRLVRLHLGWIERWPTWLKVLLPMLCTALVWGVSNRALVAMGIVPEPVSLWHVWQQALLVGITSFLVWKFLVLAMCVLFLVNSYVYLGRSHVWKFVHMTGANLLWPLRRFPIRVGKLDFSPVVGIALVLFVGDLAAHWLPRAFQNLPL